MKTLKKGLLLLFAAMFCIAGASAQKKSIAQKADDLFDQYRFYEAAEQYQKAYEKIKDNKAEKNRVYFQLAECYRLMYEYDKARRIYERLAADGYQQSEPMLYFYLAEMYRFLAESHNYKQYLAKSDEFYEKYMGVAPNDSYAAKRKASLIYASQLADARTRHEITKMEDWCTDYNDWAPRFLGDDTTKIVFTTSRFA